jgi:hypothetical protein
MAKRGKKKKGAKKHKAKRTAKQKAAARRNIKKAQAARRAKHRGKKKSHGGKRGKKKGGKKKSHKGKKGKGKRRRKHPMAMVGWEAIGKHAEAQRVKMAQRRARAEAGFGMTKKQRRGATGMTSAYRKHLIEKFGHRAVGSSLPLPGGFVRGQGG